MPDKKRVLIVVNKWWECDPFIFALLHGNVRPEKYPWPAAVNHPHFRPDKIENPPDPAAPPPKVKPRLSYTLQPKTEDLPTTNVEVWCISDFLDDYPDKPEYQSSSELKMKRIPPIFEGDLPSLVIAVGTAGFPGLESENGNVVIGSKVFIHNGNPGGKNQWSNWTHDDLEKILPSPSMEKPEFNRLTSFPVSVFHAMRKNFLAVPLNPAQSPNIYADFDFAALGVVNVTDYSEYARTDKETVDAFKACRAASKSKEVAKSLETTHGLIRVSSKAPFLFVSGLTDRVGYFDEEVTPRAHAQNTACAHNCGVVVANLLVNLL